MSGQSLQTRRRTTLAVVLLAARVSLGLQPAAAGPAPADETLARFLESGHPPLTAYRARRHLEASTRGGALQASVDAWTQVDRDGTFTFEIIEERGSDIIRGRVLRAALIEEQRARTVTQLAESALTPANYDFLVGEATERNGLLRIGLTPRRKGRMLIAGAAFVTRDDIDLVRVEGLLSKRPSFWTRKVYVVRRYARIHGVRVPVEMQSSASVLLVGESSFSMTYEYMSINGHAVRTD